MGVESNIDAVIARLQQRKALMTDVSVPVARAGIAARDYFFERFTGDNDWKPNSAFTIAQKGSSRPGIDQGTMRNSLTSVSDGNVATVGFPGGLQGRIARWFNGGTGIFAGHSEWTIRPRTKKALSFKGPGGTYFARSVTMRGQPPRDLLPLNDVVQSRVRDVFREWIIQLGAPE